MSVKFRFEILINAIAEQTAKHMEIYSHRNAGNNRHIIKHRGKNIHKKYHGNDMTI